MHVRLNEINKHCCTVTYVCAGDVAEPGRRVRLVSVISTWRRRRWTNWATKSGFGKTTEIYLIIERQMIQREQQAVEVEVHAVIEGELQLQCCLQAAAQKPLFADVAVTMHSDAHAAGYHISCLQHQCGETARIGKGSPAYARVYLWKQPGGDFGRLRPRICMGVSVIAIDHGPWGGKMLLEPECWNWVLAQN